MNKKKTFFSQAPSGGPGSAHRGIDFFKRPGAAEIARYLMLAGIVVAGALLCICHSSCQLTSQGIQALGAEESPRIKSASVINASSIEVSFSKAVNVQSASISKLSAGQKPSLDMAGENPVQAKAVMSQDKKTAVYVFEKPADLGERYQLFSQIKDARGNSLTFALPFDGFNERLPYCVLSEVQPKARSSKSDGDESPYITIRAMEDGNLFGLELFCVKKNKAYSLPNVEVKAGDEITLHLRKTKDLDACADELGSDLSLAKTGRSSAKRRDLFFDDGVPLDEKNDALYLRDRNTNKAVDALTYFKTEKDNSAKWDFSESMQKPLNDGAWAGSGLLDCAASFDGGGTTKPLVRTRFPEGGKRRPSSKYDWTVPEKSVY